MNRPMVSFSASCADGRTLDALADTISKRRKYLNETSFQSVHATAVNALKTLRAATKVAKPASISVSVSQRTDLSFSYHYLSAAKTGAKASAKMCLRNAAGVRVEGDALGKVIFADCRGRKLSSVKVYEFVDSNAEKPRRYLIAAPSQARAKKQAQLIVARRVLRFAGLAKRAMSALMVKTNNKGPSDAVSFRVAAVANRETSVARLTASGNDGGRFALVVNDDLRYAARALNGGHAAVTAALQKAANMTVGLIRHKCGDLLAPGELKTPFPDVQRRSA